MLTVLENDVDIINTILPSFGPSWDLLSLN